MPYDPQTAADSYINPGTDLDKLAQVPILAAIIQQQADLRAAETLASLAAAEQKLINLMGIAGNLRANGQSIVDAQTAAARRAAFQALASTLQLLKEGLT